MKSTALSLALMIPLLSCARSGPDPPTACATWRPILIGQEDVLSRETAEQILAHNLTGRRLCGW